MKIHQLLKSAAAVALCASVAAGCATYEASTTEKASAEKTAKLGGWGVDLDQRDIAVKPGDDFFEYANGTWLATFEMPADLSRYGMFDELRLEAEEDIRTIVQEVSAKEADAGSLEQKVGDFYGSWMDVAALDEMGTGPIQPMLDEIYAIDGKDGLTKAYASLHGDAPFGIGIIPDPADTTQYIAFVGQAGLGMPDRDYYLKDDEKFVGYREAYTAYIEKLFDLAGYDSAAERAQRVIALEKDLADVHWTAQDSRDIQKIYNPMPPAQLKELAPEFDWDGVFTQTGLTDVETFLVAQTTAIDKAAELFAGTPMDTLKDYLAFHLINNHTAYLPSTFDQASFEFYGKTLRGTEEQRERWKRGIQQVNGSLGEAIGKIYVERHFPASYKEQMQGLVTNLTDAFAERLEQNDWMDAETKEQALLKLSTFEPKIGFTDKWTDYGPLQIQQGKLLENAIAIREFQWQEQLNDLSGPVDRVQWPYPPQTVNASYNPLLNQITFPAGILQPPFFDPYADPAVNFGGIGAVIGHEIGHGFDDQGRRFDEKGRIRDWWTAFADEKFKEKTDVLGAQYAAYEPVEGGFINGQLTMGENIGDLGGLQMAYAAYRRYVAANYPNGEAPVLDGLTGDQRFFMGWAQVWRAAAREDEIRRRLVTDPHSPPEYRVNGVVRNLDAWYEAFNVSEEDALYLAPEDRVRIW
ncbi:MAG: M13 family metallopeptidase [Pseudomonadota bacterium]